MTLTRHPPNERISLLLCQFHFMVNLNFALFSHYVLKLRTSQLSVNQLKTHRPVLNPANPIIILRCPLVTVVWGPLSTSSLQGHLSEIALRVLLLSASLSIVLRALLLSASLSIVLWALLLSANLSIVLRALLLSASLSIVLWALLLSASLSIILRPHLLSASQTMNQWRLSENPQSSFLLTTPCLRG